MTMDPSLLLMAKQFHKTSNSKPPARPNTTKRRRPPTSKSKNHKNITNNLLSINLRPKLRIQVNRMMRIISPKVSLEPKKLRVLKLNKWKMRERKL